MIRLTSDYVAAAHPAVLRALAEDGAARHGGYGEDALCGEAAALVREHCRAPSALVHFVVGGTQANLLACTAALRPHQGVLAAATGHIARHETGAIEAAGHKVLELPGAEGKLLAGQVAEYVRAHYESADQEHMVQPGMVYISHPTEYGTLYTAGELRALAAACRAAGLYLYVDGARMGYGLCAPGADVDLPLLAECCDAFTIGGTKVGALFGEAMVFTNAALAKDFRYIMKQRGGMLAKGWLLGLQFRALLAGGDGCPYLTGARHAMRLGVKLAEALKRLDIPMLMPPATNQIFAVLPHGQVAALRERFLFEDWEPVGDDRMGVRFCMAWSTAEDEVDALIAALERL